MSVQSAIKAESSVDLSGKQALLGDCEGKGEEGADDGAPLGASDGMSEGALDGITNGAMDGGMEGELVEGELLGVSLG